MGCPEGVSVWMEVGCGYVGEWVYTDSGVEARRNLHIAQHVCYETRLGSPLIV